ncbi:MAG: hypothetical protein JO319_15340 [Acidobacteriaceae bacterium]|nr:hypothetical protein [Acidobacteriaceae bacterium]
MSRICTVCGYSESKVIAGARLLGLEADFRSGLYSCCQIAQWADEQSAAWLEAMQQDQDAASARKNAVESVDPEAAVVYVRRRRKISSQNNGGRHV